MESPVVQGNVGRRKAAEACSDAAANHNPDLERKKSDTKLYINNHNIGEEDDDDCDPRLSICNNSMEDINGINGGASPLFMGSPSFREYCFVGCRSADDDNLIKSSHVNDIGKETEETQRREDDIRASDEGSARSRNSSSMTGMKKTRGVRRMRKGGSPNQSHSHRPGAVRRSLMNVASCYHPAPHQHNKK
ncbi:hypothetical protein CDL12_25692 [Handroanthus impetiginosus]|uniref:Uncharacterized protein n=1 Tax=Handroanthus impetiginosus TaxID=429701 RepID=A0A2G9G9B7_9LAMI|nr:hypothetical protein CDL12_25692 [Handroanthus impetiginosus]